MYRSPLAVTPSRLKVVFPHSFKSTKSCTVQAHNFKHCEHLPASSQRETRRSTARWRHLLDSSLQTHRFTHKTSEYQKCFHKFGVEVPQCRCPAKCCHTSGVRCWKSLLLSSSHTTLYHQPIKAQGMIGKKMNKSIQKCKVLLAMVQDGWWTFSLRS